MHRSTRLPLRVTLLALVWTAGFQARAENTGVQATREYRVDADAMWPLLRDQASYLERESQGRIRIVSDPQACDKRDVLRGVFTVCVQLAPQTLATTNEGSVRRVGLRWIMELPSPDFFGHEMGHVLGLADLYDPMAPVSARRSGSMMGWVDGRQNPLSLYSLRQLGWNLVRDNNPAVSHFALFLGDQYRWCRQGECYSIGFHHRITSPTQPESWTLEGEWTQHEAQTKALQAMTRLQQRYLAYEAERGLWQIPQAVTGANDADWIEWFYVPDPVPRVLITKRDTDTPWPTTASTDLTHVYSDDPISSLEENSTEPQSPKPNKWDLPLTVAVSSLLLLWMWRLVRRLRRKS